MMRFFIGMLAWVLMFAGAGCVQAQESSLIGRKAPDFTLERLSGKSASLSEVIAGRKAVVFFFATWCPHCREQLKVIAAKKSLLQKEKIEIVLVDIGEPRARVERFLRAYGMEDDAFLDVGTFVAEMYDVMGVPMLFFIGDDGKIRYVEYGFPDNYQEILK